MRWLQVLGFVALAGLIGASLVKGNGSDGGASGWASPSQAPTPAGCEQLTLDVAEALIGPGLVQAQDIEGPEWARCSWRTPSRDAFVSFGLVSLEQIRAEQDVDEPPVTSLQQVLDGKRPRGDADGMEPGAEFSVRSGTGYGTSMLGGPNRLSTRVDWLAGDRLAILIFGRPPRARAGTSAEDMLKGELDAAEEPVSKLDRASQPR